MASTGNTQGIRLSNRPPSRAPANAAHRLSEVCGVAATRAALACSAAASAGDRLALAAATALGVATGQGPATEVVSW